MSASTNVLWYFPWYIERKPQRTFWFVFCDNSLPVLTNISANNNNNNNLEKHKLSKHEGVRFKCALCPRTFSTKGILHKHNRIKHIKHDKLKCPHCEWSFSERGNLNAHVTRKHENEKFYCDRCEKSISIFGKKKHLRLHKKQDQQKIKLCPDE